LVVIFTIGVFSGARLLAKIVGKNYECQARSERTSNKEKKTLNNMRECNKQGTREHKQCVRK
jgi:hypothetical protein